MEEGAVGEDGDDVGIGLGGRAPTAGGPGVETARSVVADGIVAPGVAHHELVVPAITVVERPTIISPQVQYVKLLELSQLFSKVVRILEINVRCNCASPKRPHSCVRGPWDV